MAKRKNSFCFFVLPVKLVLAEAGNGNPGFHFFISGVSPPRDEVPSASSGQAFCFGKRAQNHFCPCAASSRSLRLRTESRWLRNSLRSNSARRKVDSGLRLSRARRNRPNEHSTFYLSNDGGTFGWVRPVKLLNRHSRGSKRESSRFLTANNMKGRNPPR